MNIIKKIRSGSFLLLFFVSTLLLGMQKSSDRSFHGAGFTISSCDSSEGNEGASLNDVERQGPSIEERLQATENIIITLGESCEDLIEGVEALGKKVDVMGSHGSRMRCEHTRRYVVKNRNDLVQLRKNFEEFSSQVLMLKNENARYLIAVSNEQKSLAATLSEMGEQGQTREAFICFLSQQVEELKASVEILQQREKDRSKGEAGEQKSFWRRCFGCCFGCA